MTMAQTRSFFYIDTEISKVEKELAKAQERVDNLSAKLLKLQETKQDHEVKQVMDAFRKSGKTL